MLYSSETKVFLSCWLVSEDRPDIIGPGLIVNTYVSLVSSLFISSKLYCLHPYFQRIHYCWTLCNFLTLIPATLSKGSWVEGVKTYQLLYKLKKPVLSAAPAFSPDVSPVRNITEEAPNCWATKCEMCPCPNCHDKYSCHQIQWADIKNKIN